METINLLNLIKKRPELYIGQKSLSRLIFFIRGYEYSFKRSIFEGFYEFVCTYYKFHGNITHEFEKVILLYSGFNEMIAFDNFYRIYEKWNHKRIIQLIDNNKNDNIHEILKKIQDNPNQIIISKSFDRLMSFLYGYDFYKESHDELHIKVEWNKFYDYLTKKYLINNKLTLNVETIIKFISNNDYDAFDTFFNEYIYFFENKQS